MIKEKQKRIRVSKTSKRFILSFLIVLMLPVICFIFLFQQNFRDIYRSKVIEQNQKNLETVGLDLDRKLESLRILVDYNSVDSDLLKAVRMGEKGDEAVLDTFFATLVSYSFLEDVYYYNQFRPDLVYTSVGTYTVHYYAQLKGDMDSQDRFLQQLQEIRYTEWKIWGDDLIYVVRDGNFAWWMFCFDKTDLKGLITSENSATRLLDNNGNLLYVTDPVEEEDHYEISFSSQSKSFQLIREIEESYLFEELDIWQGNFTITVILIMLAGGVIVMALTYYNEQPVKKLLAYSKEKIPDIPADMDGLEAFWFTLKSMEEQAVDKAVKQEQNYLLLKLIYGQGCDTDSFKKRMKAAALFEHAQCYRVILIETAAGQEIDHNKIGLYLSMQEIGDYEYRLTDLSREDAAVMIVGMTAVAEQELRDELLLMADTIADSIDEKIRFFVGGKCTKLGEIHRSYAQAYACGQKKETGTVVFYKSAPSSGNSKGYQYPKTELGLLYDALVDIDLEKAASVTDVLITILEEQCSNRFVSVALYYDVLNAYYRALTKLEKNEEFNLTESNILVVKENADAIDVICRIWEQYQNYVEKNKGEERKAGRKDSGSAGQGLFAEWKEKADAREKDRVDGDKLIFRVLAYIDDNIQSGELSVSSVADFFNMSISHMSHKFKEQTSRNISDYITEKKFGYACELLRDTELSIKEITFIMGYNYPYSFIRKFKQQYGMTPGEYRVETRQIQTEPSKRIVEREERNR